jgi:hypothetical protein
VQTRLCESGSKGPTVDLDTAYLRRRESGDVSSPVSMKAKGAAQSVHRERALLGLGRAG